jgi:hypothetical protein
MSYDIALVRKEPEQSWDDALRVAAELDSDPDAAEIDDRTWARIEQRIRALLNAGPLSDLDQLLDPIELYCAADYATVNAPYWFRGREAARTVERMYHVAMIVTAETGLEAFDLQLDRPVARDRVNAAAAAFEAGTTTAGNPPAT